MSNLVSNLKLAPTITKVSLTFVNLIDPISTTVPIRLSVTILEAYISVDSRDATPLSVTNADKVHNYTFSGCGYTCLTFIGGCNLWN